MILDLLYHSVFVLILGTLTILFIIHAIRTKKMIIALFLSILFGFLASVCSILNDQLTINERGHVVLLTIQVGLNSIQFYFWYIHLERLEAVRVNYIRYGIVMFFLLLTFLSLFFIAFFYNNREIVESLWIFADIGYNSLAIIIFGIFGSILSYKSFDYTRDKRQILFFLAYVMIGSGFIIIAVGDLHDFIHFPTSEPFFEIFINIGHVLPLIGLFFLLGIYFSNLNYVYRLPFDVYLILVAYKTSGTLASAVWLETKKRMDFEVHLISGMLTAMNGIFGEIFESKRFIQEISGANATILFEVGNELISVVISQKSSFYLSQSLKGYLKAFEKKYSQEIQSRQPNLRKYEGAKDLISEYFPFCTIKK